MKKLLLTTLILIIICINGSISAYAYSIPNEYSPINAPFQTTQDAYKDKTTSINATNFILQTLAGALIYFAAPIAILMLVIAGTTLITGGATNEKVEAAKKHITWILIGLIVIIFSYALIKATIEFTIRAAETPPGTSGSGGTKESSIPLALQIEHLPS